MKAVLLFLAYHIALLALLGLPVGLLLHHIDARWMARGRLAISLLLLALFAALGGLFLACDVPHDPVAENILNIAAAMTRGAPMTSSSASTTIHALPYGPLLFQSLALWFEIAGTSALAAKLPSCLAAFLSLLATAALLKPRLGAAQALFGAALLGAAMISFGPYAFAPRTEVFNTLAAALALLVAFKLEGRLCHAIGGLLVGLCIGFKPHAPLYLAPALALVLRRDGPRALLVAAPVAIAAAALPWLDPRASLGDHLAFLKITARHGFELSFFELAAEWALVLALPLIPLLARPRDADATDGERAELRLASWVFLGAVALIMVPASKAGAGRHHLMPFAPAAIVLTLRGAAQLELKPAHRVVGIALLVALLGNALFGSWVILKPLRERPRAAVVLAEVAAARARRPDARVAIGFGASNDSAYLACYRRPLIHVGDPYIFNEVTLGDLRRAEQPLPEPLYEALEGGGPELWLIPKGEAPFSLPSLYRPYPPLFEERFRSLFGRRYVRVEATERFDIYERVGP